MCVSAGKIECLGRKPDWYFERRECLLNSYTLDETLPFQKLHLLLVILRLAYNFHNYIVLSTEL